MGAEPLMWESALFQISIELKQDMKVKEKGPAASITALILPN